MSEQSREQISALMDGEPGDENLYTLNALISNKEFRESWCRYHLIGETLRGNLPSHYDPHLAERISMAIKDEPVIAAPKTGRFSLTDFFKPALGFAIAASVTVAVVIGVRQISEVPSLDTTQSVAIQQQSPSINSPVSQQARVATVSTVADKPQQVVRTYKTPTDAQSRLNRYLVNHNEYRTNTGVQGMLPYVRIVAHEVGE